MTIRGSRSSTLSWWVLIAALLALDFSGETCCARDETTKCSSSCGDIRNISYPFRLKDDPKHCGHAMYALSCENNTTVLDLPSSGRYYVQAINYPNRTIRLLDPGLQRNNCSSMPQNFPLVPSTAGPIYGMYGKEGVPLSTAIFYLKCVNPVNSSLYMDTAPCLHTSDTSVIQRKTYNYVKVDTTRMGVGDLEEGCSVEWMVLALLDYSEDYNSSYKSIHNALIYGFELRVYYPDEIGPVCTHQWSTYFKCFPHSISGFFGLLWEVITGFFVRDHVYFDNRPRWFPFDYMKTRSILLISIVLFFPARLLVGAPFVIAFLIYTWRRRHLSMYSTIEDFLQSDANFLPIRYSYSEIKKMTGKFKDKLGEGGYGSVFKGKLRSGRLVAIKILDKPKGNGQDFTNEVATIGRIHHVNVVRLVGYCVEGSNRALVYDFMPNGSLDKYIYNSKGEESVVSLSCKRMHEISLGVARGIEYLHQGCEMQILHFDIKPPNILLDDNFNAKVSDFGLAKLYPVNNSIVTMTAARGTLGYIAPELFYKNIGGVSHKADVYSFGMLLMEMTSRRKNLNALAEHSSQLYFPSWAYDRYNEGKGLEMGDVTQEEKEIIRKMVITSLWCIQMKPCDRPSMKKVIAMLEGDVQHLQMPPKPDLCPQENI